MNVYADFVNTEGRHVHIPGGFFLGQAPVFGPTGRHAYIVPHTAAGVAKAQWSYPTGAQWTMGVHRTPVDSLVPVPKKAVQPSTPPPPGIIGTHNNNPVKRCVLKLSGRRGARFAIVSSNRP